MTSNKVEEMDTEFLDQMAGRFRVLAHPTRLRILSYLEKKSRSVKDIQEALELPQAKISQHLQLLRAEDILGFEKNGNQHYYFIKHENMCGILRCMEKAYSEVLE